MADNYYPPDENADAAPSGGDGGDQDKGEEMEGQTALVANDVFGDHQPEPGQTCTFKVVHCYDDQCELQYLSSDADEKKGDEGDEDKDEGTMDGAMGRLNALAK